MSDALTLDGLVVARGNRDVVRDVSIEVPPGEVTALLGPNGAGKSSMVLAIGGVLRAQGRLGQARRSGAGRHAARSGSAAPGSRSCPRAGGCSRT